MNADLLHDIVPAVAVRMKPSDKRELGYMMYSNTASLPIS